MVEFASMKGFPNQIVDFGKLASGMSCIVSLLERGENPRNDTVFGIELVRTEVVGAGRNHQTIEDYIRTQLDNSPSYRGFETTARGLRELYRLFGFIDDADGEISVTHLGTQAAEFAGILLDDIQREYWRRVVRNLSHYGKDDEASHPYQVLLRLVGRRPGISRAKCALALEAKNDSVEELERIVELSDLGEGEIRHRVGVSKNNWDNAKKVFPSFAEQLNDVIKNGQSFILADGPGRALDLTVPIPEAREVRTRVPRNARRVTVDTIGRAGTGPETESDEVEIPATIDADALANGIRLRRDRLRRHNLIVQEVAGRLQDAALFDDPFVFLAIFQAIGSTGEVNTLDGTWSY